MKTYELQTYNRTDWKIDSMFDDAEMAVDEARRVEESKRYSGVRVIEEIYDEETNRTTTRTVFRGGLANQMNKERHASKQSRSTPPAAPRYGTGREPVHRVASRAKQKQGSLLTPILLFVICALLGLLALIGLHQLEFWH